MSDISIKKEERIWYIKTVINISEKKIKMNKLNNQRYI